MRKFTRILVGLALPLGALAGLLCALSTGCVGPALWDEELVASHANPARNTPRLRSSFSGLAITAWHCVSSSVSRPQ